MKSIMHAEGALCTSDCKQQIDSSFVILFGRKHVSFFFFFLFIFFAGRYPLFQSKWTNQSQLSPEASLPLSRVRMEQENHSVSLFSLTSFPVSYLLPLFISFPLLLILARAQTHLSVCFSSLSVFLRSFYTTTHVVFSCCICNAERRGGGERLERRMASTVPHWWYFVFKWGGRMFLPECCWCWTGLAGGLYLVLLCPWTNLKAAQQLGTMGECRYKGGLDSLSPPLLFSPSFFPYDHSLFITSFVAALFYFTQFFTHI